MCVFCATCDAKSVQLLITADLFYFCTSIDSILKIFYSLHYNAIIVFAIKNFYSAIIQIGTGFKQLHLPCIASAMRAMKTITSLSFKDIL